MTELNNAVPVLKLHETHRDATENDSDGLAIFRIWTLLTGGDTLRDLTITNRKIA